MSTAPEDDGSSDVDELLIYDDQEEEYKTIHQVAINEKDKAFLQALEEQDPGTFLTISELKSKTGIKRENLGYRFDKFGNRYAELIEVKRQDKDKVPYHSPPRMAQLTEKGREAIKAGLIGNPNEDHITQTVELGKDDIDEIEEKFEQMQTRINSLEKQLEQQESTLHDTRKTLTDIQRHLSDLDSWKEDVKVFVLATRYTLQESSLNFIEQFKRAKREQKEKELTDGEGE